MRWDGEKHTRDFGGACDKAINQGRALKSLGSWVDPLMGMGLISSFRAERRSLADPEQGGAREREPVAQASAEPSPSLRYGAALFRVFA